MEKNVRRGLSFGKVKEAKKDREIGKAGRHGDIDIETDRERDMRR